MTWDPEGIDTSPAVAGTAPDGLLGVLNVQSGDFTRPNESDL